MHTKRIALAATAVTAVGAALVGTTAVANAAAPATCEVTVDAPAGSAHAFWVPVAVDCTGYAEVVLRTSLAGERSDGRRFSVPVGTFRVTGDGTLEQTGTLPFTGPVTAHAVVQVTVNGVPAPSVESPDSDLS